MKVHKEYADFVRRNLPDAPRGALPSSVGILAFTNDCYDRHPVSLMEARLIQEWLVDQGYDVGGSAVSSDGQTWVIEAVVPKLRALDSGEFGIDDIEGGDFYTTRALAVEECDQAVWSCFAKAMQLRPAQAAEYISMHRPPAQSAIYRLIESMASNWPPWL
jgi:hypothetical protein